MNFNVREEIIKILQKCGFTQYSISECENEKGIIQPIPYDIKYEKGQTWYDLLVELKDILVNGLSFSTIKNDFKEKGFANMLFLTTFRNLSFIKMEVLPLLKGLF